MIKNRLSEVLKENKNMQNKSKIKKKGKYSMVQQNYVNLGDTYQNIVVGSEALGSNGLEKVSKKQRELAKLLIGGQKLK